MKKIKSILVFLLLLASVASFTLVGCDKKDEGDNSEKTITVTVINDKKESKVFTIKTTSKNLRGALEEINLVQGEDGPYGLYIKVVDGLRADYDKDGAYWSPCKGGVPLSHGVDSEIISDGNEYELIYTKQ